MPITIGIKQRNADTGEWKECPAVFVAGKTLGAFFTESIDQEIVAEVSFNDVRCFFCGTEKWRERMERKGKAILFDRAIAVLKEKNPQLLQEIIPGLDLVESVFAGSTLNAVGYPAVEKQ